MEAQEKGPVTMREYIDAQVEFLERELAHIRKEIAHEKELGTRESEALTKALELQAEKYEQRLTQLNHEAKRLALMIPRLEFDIVIDGFENRVKVLELWKSNWEGRQAKLVVLATASAIISFIAIVLTIIKMVKV